MGTVTTAASAAALAKSNAWVKQQSSDRTAFEPNKNKKQVAINIPESHITSSERPSPFHWDWFTTVHGFNKQGVHYDNESIVLGVTPKIQAELFQAHSTTPSLYLCKWTQGQFVDKSAFAKNIKQKNFIMHFICMVIKPRQHLSWHSRTHG